MVQRIFLILICALAATATSRAAISVSGNFQTGSPTPTLSIEWDIEFAITKSGQVAMLVFDEWVTSDGNLNNAHPASSSSLVYHIVGQPDDQSVGVLHLADNLTFDSGNVTEHDGVLALYDLQVAEGDVLIIRMGQTFTFNPTGDFNSNLPTSFTGSVFLADYLGVSMSEIVQIPEPSSLILGALGSLALLRRRR
jgi:hypothetical protein